MFSPQNYGFFFIFLIFAPTNQIKTHSFRLWTNANYSKHQRMKKSDPFPSLVLLALWTFILMKVGIGTPLSAQELRTVPVIFSLWNPVATTPYDSLTRTYFNLGFQSTTHRVNGMAVNMFANLNREDVNGLQVSLISNISRGSVEGVQVSAFYNATGQQMRGLQAAIIQNVAVHEAKGLQLALMSNFIIGDGRGVQLAGLTNIAGSRFRGIQWCAGVNMVSESVKVLQISGISNICADTLRGMQLSLGNYAHNLRGVQLGLLNLCIKGEKGLQIGIVNRSDSGGTKIGLVNINSRTRMSALVYGGNTTKFNFAARFTNVHWYTILGIGSHYYDLAADFSGSVFYRLGYEIPLRRDRLYLSADAGYAHIENFQENETRPERMFSVQGRVNLEYIFTRHLGAFASGGYAYTRAYDNSRKIDSKPIVELGISLRKP